MHGGIQAELIAVNFDEGTPTLLNWWKATSQPSGAYTLFEFTEHPRQMESDYFALLFVLADCLAYKHELDPPSAQFARMLQEKDHAGL